MRVREAPNETDGQVRRLSGEMMLQAGSTANAKAGKQGNGLADVMNSRKAGTAGKVWEERGKGHIGPQATGRS